MKNETKITKQSNTITFFEKARLFLGFLMLISGLYFGLFTIGVGEGLGFLTLMASPFVMVSDK